jgi:hypothetical protein
MRELAVGIVIARSEATKQSRETKAGLLRYARNDGGKARAFVARMERSEIRESQR